MLAQPVVSAQSTFSIRCVAPAPAGAPLLLHIQYQLYKWHGTRSLRRGIKPSVNKSLQSSTSVSARSQKPMGQYLNTENAQEICNQN